MSHASSAVGQRPTRRAPTLLLLWLIVGCAPPDVESAMVFPDVDELPEQPELPDLLSSWRDGRRVETPEDWWGWRRPELLALFDHYLYGRVASFEIVGDEPLASAENVGGLDVDYEEHRLDLAGGASMSLALFRPRGVERPPVIVGPNKCGNQSLVLDDRVRVTDAFHRCGDSGMRGGRAGLWNLEAITSRGYALASFHESELAPDDPDEHATRVLRDAAPDENARTLAAWALGNRRALDFLQSHGGVDANRVAVYGHSRRGKAALWSAAQDGGFAAVIAHQSGTGGASITRNGVGESVALITSAFPHWFTDVFARFSEDEARLPVDQHQLLALVAPRPLLLVDGADDFWADPEGARDAAEAASPAWELLGETGFADGGRVSWRTRPGAHSVEPEDWTLFLDFLDAQL